MSQTVVAPTLYSDFAKTEGKLAYWKQVLPQAKIHYTTKAGKRATIDFSEQYLTDLTNSFKAKVLDQTPFMLADKDNAHTMDAERQRGEVTDMRLAKPGEKPGLYAKIEFPTEAAALAVLSNPKLGVSARIREGVEMNDGSVVPRAMIHVLGTLDPQVTGMAPWVPAVDLSFDPSDTIIDLSGATVAEHDETVTDEATVPTDEQIDAMTEDELDAFLESVAPEVLAEINQTSEVDDESDAEHVSETDHELEPALSAKAQHDIELARSAAQAAHERADEALRRMADAEWSKYQSEQMSLGVPAFVLDLAKPVLNVPDSMTIDLSNESGEADSLDVGAVVRQLVEGYKGFVDLSKESGHTGAIGAEGDPDAAMLAAWDAQYDF